MTPTSKQQGMFDRKFNRPKLRGAYDTEERFQEDTKELRAKKAEASRPFTKSIDDVAEELGRAAALATIAEEQQKLITQEGLKKGDRVQIGDYVFEVEEYATMKKVDGGTGLRAMHFQRVLEEAPEEGES